MQGLEEVRGREARPGTGGYARGRALSPGK